MADTGRVIEMEKPRRPVLEWQNEFRPDLRAEGPCRCTIELEAQDDSVRLSIVHEIEKPNSKLIQAVSGGWPKLLASLKSMLETGEPLQVVGTGR